MIEVYIYFRANGDGLHYDYKMWNWAEPNGIILACCDASHADADTYRPFLVNFEDSLHTVTSLSADSQRLVVAPGCNRDGVENNAVASIFAWTRVLAHRGGNPALTRFCKTLEEATIDTVDFGTITEELLSLTLVHDGIIERVSNEEFVEAVGDTLNKKLAGTYVPRWVVK